MTLPESIEDLEKGKFYDDGLGNITVRSGFSGSISIGSVKLEDGATTTKAKVKTDGTDNALVVMQNTAPLPTNAATSGKQDTGNSSLSSIDGKVTACNTGAVVVSTLPATPIGSNVIGKVIPTDGTTDIKLGTTIAVVSGASGATLVAGVSGKKHRIFLLTVSADTTGLVTISDGIGAHYLSASGNITLDFQHIGKLQSTANTDITITNAGGGNVAANAIYSEE